LGALARRKCVPYDDKTMPMSEEDAREYLEQIPGWALFEDHIVKEFNFNSYLDGLDFAYSLGKTAEEEDHHPDILVKCKRVTVTLTTHDIKGLSKNDFIMKVRADLLTICLGLHGMRQTDVIARRTENLLITQGILFD
jgi:4a-hydroxytetrahydrobiopterin dehydratase